MQELYGSTQLIELVEWQLSHIHNHFHAYLYLCDSDIVSNIVLYHYILQVSHRLLQACVRDNTFGCFH